MPKEPPSCWKILTELVALATASRTLDGHAADQLTPRGSAERPPVGPSNTGDAGGPRPAEKEWI
jgi:hypothetical protein